MAVVPNLPAFPLVFDRPLARARLRRAIADGGDDFLLSRAVEDLLDRLAPVKRSFADVLDLATPRAVAATRLAEALPSARIVRASPLPEALSPYWLSAVTDEELLPFKAGHFDLAVSALALHSVNDLPGTLAQLRRCLKPDGLFLAALIGGQSLTELRSVLSETDDVLFGGASPHVAPFADLRDLGHLLQRAGFALPVTDIDRVTVRYANVFALFSDLRSMGMTNALVERRRTPLTRRYFALAADLYAKRFADPDGRIRATIDIVWLSGWSPHESQQQPLKPGSAKMRLADALNTKEHRLGREGG